MTDSFDDIKPNGLEEIPNSAAAEPVEAPPSMKPVDGIPKPEVDVKLELKDAAPIIEEQLKESLLETLKSGWSFNKTLGLALTIISFVIIFVLNRC